ncbi:hypothetical protein ACHHYP_04639 [Achlya hypogyna]|uniref:Secreted protein n=1 Tax=Achlya hypogyna TaxID=1202772 RepID=A0A0A7CM85_ACHHY|nr:secreted protein [Achlya hypogyna]OQR99728.1 hypothetical protein ACHHYP_04639 [Achlya hypogyna]
MEDPLTLLVMALVLFVTFFLFKSQAGGEAAPAAARQAAPTPVSARAGQNKVIVPAKLTAAAKVLHARLPLRQGVRSICLSGNALFSSPLAEATSMDPHLAQRIADFAAVSDVFLLFLVRDEAEKALVLPLLNATPQLRWDPATQSGIQPHRLLFCTTVVGKIAFVRQIEPVVLIEENREVAAKLQPFVPKVVFLLGATGDVLPDSSKDNVEYHTDVAAYHSVFAA